MPRIFWILILILFSTNLQSQSLNILDKALLAENRIDSLESILQTQLKNRLPVKIYQRYVKSIPLFQRLNIQRPSKLAKIKKNPTAIPIKDLQQMHKVIRILKKDIESLKKLSNKKIHSSSLSYKEILHNEISYEVVEFDPLSNEYNLELHLDGSMDPEDSSFRILDNTLQDVKMLMNAGMYTNSYLPQGLFISDRNVLKKLNKTKKKKGNFYLDPSGVFGIDTLGMPFIYNRFDQRLKDFKRIRLATQSGPILLTEGKTHPVFQKKSKHFNIRNGVGITDKNTLVFIISSQPVTLYGFSQVFKERYNCSDALYLDGAISSLYVADLHSKPSQIKLGPIFSISKKPK